MISFFKYPRRRHQVNKIDRSIKLPSLLLRTTPLQLIAWIVVIFVVAVLIIVIRSAYWQIRTHTCTYFQDSPCPDIIEAELAHYHGQNILLFSPQLVQNKLLAVEPRAKQVNVSVLLPGTIAVEFIQEDLLANIKIATNSASLLVSNSYIVTGQSHTSNVRIPEVIYPTAISLRVGDKIVDSPLEFSLKIIQQLTKSFIQVPRVIVYSDRLILVDLPKEQQAIFTTHADLSRQVTSLQLILSKATISQGVPVIDVRYEQPILRPLR